MAKSLKEQQLKHLRALIQSGACVQVDNGMECSINNVESVENGYMITYRLENGVAQERLGVFTTFLVTLGEKND